MKSSSRQPSSESQFFLVMSLLVVLMGGPTVYSFLAPGGSTSMSVTRLGVPRAPSSLKDVDDQKAELSSPKASQNSALLKLNCDNEMSEWKEEVTGSYVRLLGQSCKGSTDLQITNAKSGFSASIIFTKDQKFTTDFIAVSEGVNKFTITSTQANGSKLLRTLTIVRNR